MFTLYGQLKFEGYTATKCTSDAKTTEHVRQTIQSIVTLDDAIKLYRFDWNTACIMFGGASSLRADFR